MKIILLILLPAFVSLFASAQAYREISLQPDSVYKAHKVHSRIGVHAGSPSKSKEIYVFDEDGRPTALIMTDNETGNIPQIVTYYSYNDKGALSGETDTAFRGNRYSATISEMFYSADGALLRQVETNGGHKYRESDFNNAERKVTDKLFRNDTVYREETTTYDAHGTPVRFSGKELADPNGKPTIITNNGKSYAFPAQKEDRTWDYTYINTYDSAGNLLLQERYENGQLKARTTFKMNENGLLTALNDSRYSYVYY